MMVVCQCAVLENQQKTTEAFRQRMLVYRQACGWSLTVHPAPLLDGPGCSGVAEVRLQRRHDVTV